MSDVHQENDHHESPIKTPKQLITVVIAAFLVPILVIILLVSFVGHGTREGAGSSQTAEAVNSRIHPVASLEIKDLSAPRVFKAGEQVYKEVCAACHATGAAGAPKYGTAGDWAPRIGQGFDGLMKSVLGGKGAMPARAGTTPDDYTDYELGRAVVYMADAGGAKFPEPPAPAATAQAAAPAADSAAPAAPATAAPAPAAAPAAAAAAPAAASADTGKKVYDQVCAACHAAGVAGAPKLGDKTAWAPRIKEGMDAVHNFALKGKGVMPPKGGYAGPDADVLAAADYMVNAAK